MTEAASTEALRIVRSLEVKFPTGPAKRGSAFVVAPGQLVTCAHVVMNGANETASGITVQDRDTQKYPATVGAVDPQYDLARLDADAEETIAPKIGMEAPRVGRQVVFAGQPIGVTRPGVFFGIVSDYGTNRTGTRAPRPVARHAPRPGARGTGLGRAVMGLGTGLADRVPSPRGA